MPKGEAGPTVIGVPGMVEFRDMPLEGTEAERRAVSKAIAALFVRVGAVLNTARVGQ